MEPMWKLDFNKPVDRIQALMALKMAESIFINMKAERVGFWKRLIRRFEISDEPLRADARRWLVMYGPKEHGGPRGQLADEPVEREA